jgi:aminoglycoside phosphotransferase (APT) family kinase protein
VNEKSVLPLPLAAREITEDWVCRATGLDVSEVLVKKIIEGTSTKIRIAVTGDGDLPASLIVKGGFEDHSPDMAAMYANEARYYRDIAPALPLPTPRCWFAGSDPDSYQSIVILEDLDLAGVTWLHGQKPQSPAAVARRLAVLAEFHAASWIGPPDASPHRFSGLDGRFTAWSMDYVRRYLVPDVWAHYCRSPRGAAVSVSLHDRLWMENAFVAFAQIEASGPRCVIHGDTHLGNLFEWPDGTPGFLDAQPAFANPIMEIAYHVTAALDIADRRDAEQGLLADYLSALTSFGVTPPTFDEAWLTYRQFLAYGFFIFLINETRFQSEAVNTANAARFGAAMLDHDVMALLK